VKARSQQRTLAVHRGHFRAQRTAGADPGYASDPARSPLLS